ncbi:PTS sugar transporter subunit IIA [Pelistega europaea]|uniref:PTS EIIA type-4 domain-containing protein n=1 Tax=Pelistega europaea TaxID=106147 RepID=A0A7Y4P6L7_9BURK|nr:hypothetical protein [Pelistega europaea]NOL49875.1 hypothetical protein [Pelistega europaea]
MSALIVVVTHAPLASALREVVLHVFPTVDTMLVYDILPDVQPEVMQAQIMADVQRKQQSTQQRVLVFSDLIGATPANIAMRVVYALNPHGVPVTHTAPSSLGNIAEIKPTMVERSVFFGGVNVCMLLNAVRYADLPVDELKAKILEGGKKGMQTVDCSCMAS